MPNDAKLGLLAGVVGVLVAAVVAGPKLQSAGGPTGAVPVAAAAAVQLPPTPPAVRVPSPGPGPMAQTPPPPSAVAGRREVPGQVTAVRKSQSK